MSRFRIEGGGNFWNTRIFYGDEQLTNVTNLKLELAYDDPQAPKRVYPKVTLELINVDLVLDSTVAYSRKTGKPFNSKEETSSTQNDTVINISNSEEIVNEVTNSEPQAWKPEWDTIIPEGNPYRDYN